MKNLRFLLLGVMLIMALIFTGCTDATLKQVAQAELDVAQGISTASAVTQASYASGAITSNDAAAVTQLLLKINAANGSAIKVTKNLTTIDPSNQSALRDIISPLIMEINTQIASGAIFAIKNQSAKASIQTALAAIVTTLEVIQSKLPTKKAAMFTGRQAWAC